MRISIASSFSPSSRLGSLLLIITAFLLFVGTEHVYALIGGINDDIGDGLRKTDANEQRIAPSPESSPTRAPAIVYQRVRRLSGDDDDRVPTNKPTRDPRDDGGIQPEPGTLPPALVPNATGIIPVAADGPSGPNAVQIGVGIGVSTLLVSLGAVGFIVYTKRRVEREENAPTPPRGGIMMSSLRYAASPVNGLMGAASNLPNRMVNAMPQRPFSGPGGWNALRSPEAPPRTMTMVAGGSTSNAFRPPEPPPRTTTLMPGGFTPFQSNNRTLSSIQEARGDSASSRSDSNVMLCRVLYDYKANSPAELHLHVGDTIQVRQRPYGGWYEGRSMQTGQSGIFPEQYVRVVSNNNVNNGTRWAGPSFQ